MSAPPAHHHSGPEPDAPGTGARASGRASGAGAPAVETRDLCKSFGSVRALEGVSLRISPGEVRGIVGENGAGKSTLMKILAGVQSADSGEVLLHGVAARLGSPAAALRAGIAMIHQELNLIDELTVADNILLGREEATRAGFVRRERTRARARAALGLLGSGIDPRARVRSLSIAQKQLVEIARALDCDASILIMDEPTAVLTRAEAGRLFDLIRALHARRVTVLYISHTLSDVLAICSNISVMRDGRHVETLPAADATEASLARLMVGRELPQLPHRSLDAPRASPVLELRGVSVPGFARDISLELQPGEVLGLAGLVGAGRTELAESIVGLRPISAGHVLLRGVPTRFRSPRDAAGAGVVYLSEDRRALGLVMDMSVTANATLASIRRYCTPFLHRGRERRAVRDHIQRLGIRLGHPGQPVRTLSGGNQQKVALAKWLDLAPDVLILDEPTRGVDIGARLEIHTLIRRLLQERPERACLMISSDMPELLALSDRIAVMRTGRLMGVLERAEFSQERVMYLAAGVDDHRTATSAPLTGAPPHGQPA